MKIKIVVCSIIISDEIYSDEMTCAVCKLDIEIENLSAWLSCPKCPIMAHLFCLSRVFLKYEEELSIEPNRKPNLIPIHGLCPGCKTSCKWGNLVTSMNKRIESINDFQEIETMNGVIGHCRKATKKDFNEFHLSDSDSEFGIVSLEPSSEKLLNFTSVVPTNNNTKVNIKPTQRNEFSTFSNLCEFDSNSDLEIVSNEITNTTLKSKQSTSEKLLNFTSVVPTNNNTNVNIKSTQLNELSTFSKRWEFDSSSDLEIVSNEIPNTSLKSKQSTHFETIQSDPLSAADSEDYSEIFVTNLKLTK
jgi:hypothetical protein